VYKIQTAKNPRHHENRRAEIAAANHHNIGQRYGTISNKPANIARVHFCGTLTPNISSIRSPRYDIIHINIQRKISLFNQVVIPE
jgi:hypothetical protein